MPTINLNLTIEVNPENMDESLLKHLLKSIEEMTKDHVAKMLTGKTAVKTHTLESYTLSDAFMVVSEERVEIKCPHCDFIGNEGWNLIEEGAQTISFNPVNEGTAFELSAFPEFHEKEGHERLACPECGEDSRMPKTFHDYLE